MQHTFVVPRSVVSLLLAGAILAVAACGKLPTGSEEQAGFGSTVEAQESKRPEERFEFTSYTEVGELFEELNYTPEAWQAGIREVPRVYLTTIAPRWRDRVSKEVSVLEKKRIFFRSLAPLALRSNEIILHDRERVAGLRDRISDGGTISTEERKWLTQLAFGYGVANFRDVDQMVIRAVSSAASLLHLGLRVVELLLGERDARDLALRL